MPCNLKKYKIKCEEKLYEKNMSLNNSILRKSMNSIMFTFGVRNDPKVHAQV